MRSSTRILTSLALFALVGSSVRADAAQEDVFSFGYCAPPILLPKCIDAEQTDAKPDSVAACQQEVTRYVKFVLAYRDCLIRESERAILQTNKVLDRFKCSAKLKRTCP